MTKLRTLFCLFALSFVGCAADKEGDPAEANAVPAEDVSASPQVSSDEAQWKELDEVMLRNKCMDPDTSTGCCWWVDTFHVKCCHWDVGFYCD